MVQRCQNHRKTIELNGGLKKKNINHSIALKNWPSLWSSQNSENWLFELISNISTINDLNINITVNDTKIVTVNDIINIMIREGVKKKGEKCFWVMFVNLNLDCVTLTTCKATTKSVLIIVEDDMAVMVIVMMRLEVKW